jgi:two-component system NarL family response regulator
VKKARPIRIIIAEDHLIARRGLSAIINAQPDMKVIAEATNGKEAIALYREHTPDVMLVDMRMPVLTGFETVSAIRAEFPAARFVAISTFGGDVDIQRALLAGAQSFLTKDTPNDDLINAIRAVHAGQKYLPPSIASELKVNSSRPSLTAREIEVLRLIVQGLTNKEIAYAAGIANYTVYNHVKSILEKLGVADRTQAATVAIVRGIVHLHH